MDLTIEELRRIDHFWQHKWKEDKTYQTVEDNSKPKYYVLDMFPYPSGAGLHVGHPLGYVASDIVARYKKHKGFNVLHPMGFDAFGLPAEQYAIETGQHPAKTTEINSKKYIEQLNNIGFSFDWDRKVTTSDPNYYKWTQYIFLQLFNSWYDKEKGKARPIADLVEQFEKEDASWTSKTEQEQQAILMNYRLAYLSYADVNWCPALGTVLANDEVKDGVSERGGHPVIKKLMRQWFLRITEYADQLLTGLDNLNWPDSMKEIQRNWIGKSEGASVKFSIETSKVERSIEVFTTRPDTIFGCTFIVLAPEHDLVKEITTTEQKGEIEKYLEYTASRSERERIAEVKKVTGAFTGAYALHPFTEAKIPIYVADYVLSGYGTGAIMAVPAHDSRDYAFAKEFNIEIKEVVSGGNVEEASYDAKEGKLAHSDFLNGLEVTAAKKKAIQVIEERQIGTRQVNYRLRDAAFSRQRYWGEPFPIYYKNDIPYPIDVSKIPLELPPIDTYKPTEDGAAPLARAKNWETEKGYTLETDTMPGYAGSSWYFLRYMDPENESEFVSKEKADYWQQVDLYVGGAEHATGHLLYARFWTHFLHDLGYLSFKEPFKKLVNQGMIQGKSSFTYRVKDSNQFVSFGLKDQYDTTPIHVDINLVNDGKIEYHQLADWKETFKSAEFILENGQLVAGEEVEKMSKSKYNVVNPDDVINQYGADVFRMYEMFLGPIEMHKPWDTKGIDGVYRFIKKLWKLFLDSGGNFSVADEKASQEELKVLHKTIKKVSEDIENLSFNTCISAFMIAVNELTSLTCNKKEILEPLVILLSPFAPHLAEELWNKLGNPTSVTIATYPIYQEKHLTESSFNYPVAINGKMRVKIEFPLDLAKTEIEKEVLSSEEVQKWLENKSPKKVIVVPGKIVNIVI